MHGALSTQKLDLHAIQLKGCIGGNLRSCQGSVPFLVALGPENSLGHQAIFTCKQRSSEPKPHILFYSYYSDYEQGKLGFTKVALTA